MAILKMTPADILKGKLLDAGWYPAKVVKVDEDWTPTADKQSMNTKIVFEILGTGGKEIEVIINSKGIGFASNMIAAARGSELKLELQDIDTAELLGKELDVQLIQDAYNGRMSNKISSYLPKGRGSKAQTY
jgi:hypothetical protein